MLVLWRGCRRSLAPVAGCGSRRFAFQGMQAAPLHPTPKEREAMLQEVGRFLERLEQTPPPLAGSGYRWIVDPDSEDHQANQAAVDALPLAIGSKPFAGGLTEILQQVIQPGVHRSTNDNSPGYMAYIPSGALFHSAVADLISTTVNRYVTIDQAAPAFAAIERECVQWMCTEVAGWQAGGPCGGVLTSGGSMANMIALHAARSSKIRIAELPKATVYVSEQAHYCLEMGAKFIGVQPTHVRKVPSSPSDHAMCLDRLTQMLEADIAEGLVPIAVCAMAGTTNSGAVDDIEGISKICSEKNVWMHVDGAYGGFFALTAQGRAALKGMEKADSVVVDPHKSLFLPYGLGAVLLRNQFFLKKGNVSDGACMQPPAASDHYDVEDIMNLSPELTRDFRGLRMWLPLQMLGAQAFRDQLEEKLALARYAAAAIGDGSVPNLRVVAEPQLSIFTFKLEDGVKKGAELDALNAEFLNHVHKRGNVLLSPFRSVHGIPGELCIRMAILSHRTDLAMVELALADVRAAALEAQGLASEGEKRACFHVSAEADFVKDYKELAKMDIWDRLLEQAPGSPRVFDTMSGTGRWAQAFSELVVKDRKVSVDFLDLCGDSLAVLSQRAEGLSNLGEGKCYSGDVCDLAELGVPPLTYDIITNMHGFYGVPRAKLPVALRELYDTLRPGGTMVIAIGAEQSTYQNFASFCGAPYISEQQITGALSDLGIQCSTRYLTYTEDFAAADKAGLERFLGDECMGNSFPAQAVEGTKSPSDFIQKYADQHFDPISGTHSFEQKIAVMTVTRSADVLPEMQSFGPFYSEAYTLRREASTMQSNMITWLKDSAATQILTKLDVQKGRPLRIYSIGCGDGELDLALVEGIMRSVDTTSFTGIEFLGVEPSPSFRQTFLDNFHASQGQGTFPSPEQCSIRLEGETFEPNRDSEHLEEGQADIVLLGHVMYYFQEKEEALRSAMRLMRPGGITVVIIQTKEGVPELQEALLPKLRGSVRDMYTADDVEQLSRSMQSGGVQFDRYDVEAFLDVSEIAKGSDDGVKIMSFCLEADHRAASSEVLQMSREAFAAKAVPAAEAGRRGGPFLPEPVSCFVVRSTP